MFANDVHNGKIIKRYLRQACVGYESNFQATLLEVDVEYMDGTFAYGLVEMRGDAPMPNPNPTNDEQAHGLIEWVFRAQPSLLPIMKGIYDFHRGIGLGIGEGIQETFKAFTEE